MQRYRKFLRPSKARSASATKAVIRASKMARIRCNQCEALMINGVFCHETGCPNTKARYDADSGEWIKQYKCFTCGCMADEDSNCCSEEFDAEENL